MRLWLNARGKSEKMELPPKMLLEVTSRCNYRCPFCYCVWHESAELGGRDLGTAAWKGILEECASRGVREFQFSGGEATLRRDIWDLLAHARRLLPQGQVSLFTNGSRMTEERLLWCRDQRIGLATSLQGLRSHAAQTGTRRSCQRTLAFIARAAEASWPVAVSITISRGNREEASDLFAAAVLAGAGDIQMEAVMVEGRMRRHPEDALSREEWEAVKAEVSRLPSGGVPFGFGDELLCECRVQPESLRRAFGNPAAKPCPAGKDFGVIGPNGKYRRCLHTVEALDWR